jgi:3-oxoacyl-[acyl-carrier-protein] synthase-3
MSPLWNTPGVRISSIAAVLPSATISNQDLVSFGADARYVERLSEVVGVSHRHVVCDGQFGSHLATAAAQRVIEAEGWKPSDIDVLVVATQTPDRLFPGISFSVHRDLGCSSDCAVFDVNLGCSGFVYGAWLVANALAGGTARRGLLVTVDTMSRTLRADDFGNRILFGDGAAAISFERDQEERMVVALASDGRGEGFVNLPGTAMKVGSEDSTGFHINGPAVLALALRNTPRMIEEVLSALPEGDTLLVPHQANEFILNKLRDKMNWPEDHFIINMRTVGNTSSTSIPLALCGSGARYANKLSRVGMVGFGTGFSWGMLVADLSRTSLLGIRLLDA